ncbi:MAG: septum site-determining protein MinC [Selenomonadaceae bacterium]|nr:septum site-determining protein MinC [Selenomonadaceae bacterium]MBQ7629981.1 septum site-determining protein MinC [Selenomonadaceae bacterium]
MSDIVKIRGLKSGLQLSFANGARFEDVQANLLNKLETGSNFFIRGTTVFMPKGYFTEEQNETLRKMFHRHGMLFSMEFKPPTFSTPTPSQNFSPTYNKPAKIDTTPAEKNSGKMIVINRTIRGGQEVRTDDSVMICGNVNPGAQVISGGSVDIRGTCRGIVHAGVYGDETAFVVADKLMPTQIRIANVIARSPDNAKEVDRAERASIKNGYIVFEPIMR